MGHGKVEQKIKKSGFVEVVQWTESPSRVYPGGKGCGSGGSGSPSVVVYVNNHAGAANPPLTEQQVRSEGAFEDHALGKASGKAHQRGLTVLSQGSAAGTVRVSARV